MLRESAAVLALLLASGPAPAFGQAAPQAVEAPALKAGDPAPAFSLPGTDGKTHDLEEHLGKRAVVIAWFPKAFTGG